MKHLLSSGLLVALAACQSNTESLERKLDAQSKALADQSRAIAALSAKVDRLAAGGGVAAAAAVAPARPQRIEPDPAKVYAVSVDGDPFDGPADAKVTLVKGYDYACPYCERVRPTLDELRQRYGNDLRIVYKQLVVHPKNAMASALAFCAATRQGKGKELDQIIWEKGFKQRKLDTSDVMLAGAAMSKQIGAGPKCWETAAGCPLVVGWAQELGLDIPRFKADMKGDCQTLVQNDMRSLQQFGVAATPAFFINGRFMSGAMPIENFSDLIDEELKKANARIQSGTPAAKYYQQWVVEKGLRQLDRPGMPAPGTPAGRPGLVEKPLVPAEKPPAP